jgi:hypothetical protein
MRKSLLQVGKVGFWAVVAAISLLFPAAVMAQSKVEVVARPSATITEAKQVKGERIKSRHITKHKRKKTVVKTRIINNPSDDDKKLQEIKEAKNREKGIK